MGFLFAALLFFLCAVGGFSFFSFLFSSAYRDAGGLGIIGVIVFLYLVIAIAVKSNNGEDKK